MADEILVFGSAIVDFICYVQRLPKPGETIHGTKFCTGFGGKGANQCVAANRLGARTALVAKLGDDSWGTNYLEHLRKEGVNVDYVERLKGQTTGIAQISVSGGTGENHIIIVTGANNLLKSDDVTNAKAIFEKSKILICQLETPVDATLTALRSFNGISILNAAPAMSELPKELLQSASILCVNETEAALMIGCDEIATLEQAKYALDMLLKMGARTVIITLGRMGAVYVSSKESTTFIHVPTRKVEKVVDTTGAGDAFIGSLAFYMLKYPELPMHQIIGAACNVASISVQHPGTQSSFPKYHEITDIELNKYEWAAL